MCVCVVRDKTDADTVPLELKSCLNINRKYLVFFFHYFFVLCA